MSEIGPVALLDLKGSMDWQGRAECQLADPELFYPIDKKAGLKDRERVAQALHFCARCPVRQECLEWAQENGESGVYGGLYLGKGGRIIDIFKG